MVERLTPERRRQLTRGALVEAAAHLFARRGFHAASLDEIAEAAGFSRGAIYSNFGGKEELFFAVLDLHNEEALRAFSTAFDEAGGASALGAAEAAKAWRKIMVGDLDWLALTLEFRLYALRNPEVKERFASWARRSQQGVTRFIEETLRGAGLTLGIPLSDLAVIVDAASSGLQEMAYLDSGNAHVFESFVQLIIDASVEGDDPSARAQTARRAP